MFPWLGLYSTRTNPAEHVVTAAIGSVEDDLDCDLLEVLNLSIDDRPGVCTLLVVEIIGVQNRNLACLTYVTSMPLRCTWNTTFYSSSPSCYV